MPGSVLPPQLRLRGLDQKCKKYLYHEIREFCKPGTEDLHSPAQLRFLPEQDKTAPLGVPVIYRLFNLFARLIVFAHPFVNFLDHLNGFSHPIANFVYQFK